MIAYIIEVTLYWAIFCTLYHFTLRKLTFFRFNRWFLLGSLSMGLVLPLLSLQVGSATPVLEDTILVLAPISNTPAIIQESFNSSPTFITLSNVLLLLYWIGVLGFSFKFILGIVKLIRLYATGSKIKYQQYTLVRTKELHLPFSFLNCIFWSDQVDYLQDGEDKVMMHELAHVRDGHSFDVLFMELVKIFLWCSPLVYWYHKSIKQIHEYIADHTVLKTTQLKNYGHLLLSQSQSGMQIALANHFIQSQLKNRITMMLQKPSSRKSLLKYLWLLPLILIMTLLISAKDIPPQNITNNQQSNIEEVRGAYPDLQGLIVILREDKPAIYFRIFEYESSLAHFLTEKLSLNENDILAIAIDKNGKGSLAQKYPKMEADQYMEVKIKSDAKLQFESSDVILKEAAALEQNESVVVDIFNGRTEIHKLDKGVAVSEDLKINKKVHSEQDMFTTIETQPRFPGCESLETDREKELCGKKELLGFIYKNVKYPTEARNAGIEGMTIVSFDIDIDGSLSNFKLARDIGGGTGEESLRVARLLGEMSGKWTPGTMNGKPVKVQYNLPIKFKLADKDQSKDDNVKVILFLKDGTKFNLKNRLDLKKSIKPEDIIELNVLKGESMQEKYPEHVNSDGVIEIYTLWGKEELFIRGLKEALTKESITKTKPEIENLFKVVEDMPRFPGCEEVADKHERDDCAKNKMLQWIYENIKYPTEARNQGIQGMVVIRFVVERDGSLSNIEIVREIGGGAGEEGARIVESMNQMDMPWIPGRQRGKAVRVLYNLPIRFKLSNEEGAKEINKASISNKLELDNVLIFPNPASRDVQITFSAEKTPIIITLYDLLGKEIHSESLNAFDGLYSRKISVESAARGTAVLTVKQGDKIFTKQILLK